MLPRLEAEESLLAVRQRSARFKNGAAIVQQWQRETTETGGVVKALPVDMRGISVVKVAKKRTQERIT